MDFLSLSDIRIQRDASAVQSCMKLRKSIKDMLERDNTSTFVKYDKWHNDRRKTCIDKLCQELRQQGYKTSVKITTGDSINVEFVDDTITFESVQSGRKKYF